MNKKLAIISTHPIQYYAPVFQLLAKELDILVFYTWGEKSMYKYDHGFKQKIEWDLPILERYNYVFLANKSTDQGTHHFNGINNLTIINDIENFNPDAILVYGWAWKSHLKIIRFFKGKVPIYFRGDSTLLNKKKGFKDLIKTLFLKWVYRHIDYSFYVGTANKAYYETYGLKESQLIFAPHAIDNERFAEDRILDADLIRKKLGIKKEEVLILFAGKFETVKNPNLLLQAFMELDLLNVHLLFVGNGVLEESLKLTAESLEDIDVLRQAQDDSIEEDSRLKVEDLENGEVLRQAQDDNIDLENSKVLRQAHDDITEINSKLKVEDLENGEVLQQAQDDNNKENLKFIPPPTPSRGGQSRSLKKRIHFMSFQNQTQMPAIYQACDLFCLPSKSETWGLAVNEAMASGKAVLVSDKVGCTKDLVKPKINGDVFKSEDLTDLKSKLRYLVTDKNELSKLGEASKKIIKDWSFEKQVNSFLETFNS